MSPRRFVYDLRYASDHFSGIGTHAYGLARALLETPGEERWTFLAPPPGANTRFDLAPLRACPRVDWVETSLPPLGWNTAARTGAWLRRAGGDAYLSPFWLQPERAPMPVVLTLHDVLPLAVSEAVSWPRRLLYRFAIARAREAAAVLVSSRFTRDEVARRTSVPPERLHVVPLGVAPPGNAMRRPEGAGEAPYALVVGVNKPHKNLAVLDRAWAGAEGPPLDLLGAGFVDPRYPALPAASRNGHSTRWLGRVSGEELEWLYRHATLVVCPTRYEGFGLPLLEAAARGVPVVASDIPPLRETGEGVARFVPADDARAWAREVGSLASDAGARAAMIEAGRVRASEYDYATCAARTLQVVRNVAGR